ncbi:MAG: class A beta-lactamase [Flavobacteriales bacterium]
MKYISIIISFWLLLTACNDQQIPQSESGPIDKQKSSVLRDSIASIVASYRAEVGVAIISPDGDTISLKGDRQFAMMSVCKIPQALALLHLIDEGKMSMDEQIQFDEEDMKQKTSSGILEDHPHAPFNLPMSEVLHYAVGQSDNVTSNKMFELAGGPAAVEKFIHSLGIIDIGIAADYTNLYKNVNSNWSTPKAMAQLLENFYQKQILSDKTHPLLWTAMVNAISGPNRIKGMLPEGTIVAHKTGTGNTNEATGKIESFNDAGIVMLPDGRHFCIAVFVANSEESEEKTAEVIARVARVVWDSY